MSAATVLLKKIFFSARTRYTRRPCVCRRSRSDRRSHWTRTDQQRRSTETVSVRVCMCVRSRARVVRSDPHDCVRLVRGGVSATILATGGNLYSRLGRQPRALRRLHPATALSPRRRYSPIAFGPVGGASLLVGSGVGAGSAAGRWRATRSGAKGHDGESRNSRPCAVPSPTPSYGRRWFS